MHLWYSVLLTHLIVFVIGKCFKWTIATMSNDYNNNKFIYGAHMVSQAPF